MGLNGQHTTSKSFYLELPCPACGKTIAFNFIKRDLRKAMKNKRELVRYKAYWVDSDTMEPSYEDKTICKHGY